MEDDDVLALSVVIARPELPTVRLTVSWTEDKTDDELVAVAPGIARHAANVMTAMINEVAGSGT